MAIGFRAGQHNNATNTARSRYRGLPLMDRNDTLTVLPVPHPGEFIREELEAREWTQRDLAFVLGVPEQAVNMLVTGKRGISPDMAKALGTAFDVPAEFFSNLQNAYDLSKAREPDPAIERRALLQKTF